MSDEVVHLFEEFTLDPTRGCLLCAGEPIHLRPQSYEVLKYLVEHKGRLVSKDRLIEEVWRGRAVTDDSLVQCLRDVRHAFGGGGDRYIRNVRGRGYIFDPRPDEGEARKPLKVQSEEIRCRPSPRRGRGDGRTRSYRADGVRACPHGGTPRLRADNR